MTPVVAGGTVVSRRPDRILWGLLPFTLLVGASVLAQGRQTVPAGLPDASTGQINGKIAITVAPLRIVDRELLSPWGFKAHLTGYDDPLEKGYPRWELSRRTPVRDAAAGLLMPVGPAIGALWDESLQRYTALSRPFEVRARQEVQVPLEQPGERAALVVQAQRPNLAASADDASMNLELIRGDRRLPPDLTVALADRAYAIWYSLVAGPAELRAETRDASLAPQHISFAQGRIERVFVKLVPRAAWTPSPVQGKRLAQP